jgi:hypothetical protein
VPKSNRRVQRFCRSPKRALLENAAADFVPAVALGLFAGLRPESEIWALDALRAAKLVKWLFSVLSGVKKSASGFWMRLNLRF